MAATDAMLKVGVEPMTGDLPKAFSAFMREELQRWSRVARDFGARAD